MRPLLAVLCGAIAPLGCFGLKPCGEGAERCAAPGGDAAGGPADASTEAPLANERYSGTRLHARHYVTPEGRREFIDFRDVERYEDCSFAVADDGELRCLPSDWVFDDGFFADAACTRRIARAYAWDCPPSRYLAEQVAVGCAVGIRLYPLGFEHDPAAGVWVKSGDSCYPWDLYPDERYFELGEPLAPGEFVRGEAVVLDTPARVDPAVIVGDDGARDFIGLHDGELDTRCHVGRTVDGTYRCVPDGPYAWGYHDAACTQAVASQLSSCAMPPEYAKQSGWDGCVSSSRVFAVAGEASGEVYGEFGDECIPGLSQPDQRYFFVGAELPPETFTPWRLDPAAEGGRLRPYLFRSDAGPTWAARLWYDVERGEDCTIGFASDGRLRCLPYDTAFGERYFRDATCQTELEIADATPRCGQTPTLATQSDLSCPRRSRLRSLGAPVPAGTRTWFDWGDGDCSEIPLGEGVYLELGEEVSPAGYGELTLATDPGPTGPPP